MSQHNLEFRWDALARAFVWAALTLSFVLLFAQPRASALDSRETRLGATSAMSSPSVAAFDCAPCARCYVAPTPESHRFSSDDQPPKEHRGRVLPSSVFSATLVDTAGWYVPLPVRIAFCRWLD